MFGGRWSVVGGRWWCASFARIGCIYFWVLSVTVVSAGVCLVDGNPTIVKPGFGVCVGEMIPPRPPGVDDNKSCRGNRNSTGWRRINLVPFFFTQSSNDDVCMCVCVGSLRPPHIMRGFSPAVVLDSLFMVGPCRRSALSTPTLFFFGFYPLTLLIFCDGCFCFCKENMG